MIIAPEPSGSISLLPLGVGYFRRTRSRRQFLSWRTARYSYGIYDHWASLGGLCLEVTSRREHFCELNPMNRLLVVLSPAADTKAETAPAALQ